MQTCPANQSHIKKQVPFIFDLQQPYKISHGGLAKPVSYKLSIIDTWLYRITLIALGAGILKLVIVALL
jgi:hypothetical protein